MPLVAVNVCVLLPLSLAQFSVELSRRSCLPSDDPSRLGYQLSTAEGGRSNVGAGSGQLQPKPHITLTQLFIDADEVESLKTKVSEVVQQVAQEVGGTDNFCLAVEPRLVDGPVFAVSTEPSIGAVHLPSIPMKVSKRLPSTSDSSNSKLLAGDPDAVMLKLHMAIAAAVRPFRYRGVLTEGQGVAEEIGTGNQQTLSAAFSPHWPGNTASVQWVVNYDDKSSGPVKYFPHITLGAVPSSRLEALHSTFSELRDQLPSALVVDSLPVAFPGAAGSDVGIDHDECFLVVVSRMGNYCSCLEIL